MQEKIERLDFITGEYLYKLHAEGGDVTLYFQPLKIIFYSYVIFKSGDPNEEVANVSDFPDISTVYKIENSNWIEEIKIQNRSHPKHKDEIFAKFKHFKIRFSDETFDCIANSYEIIPEQ